MQLLKTLVIVMGVLIVAGFAVIGVEVYKRIVDPTRGNRPAVSAAATPAPPVEPSSPELASVPAPVFSATPREVVLDLPAGARIGELVAVGNRVLFKVTLPQGPDRLYLVDPQTGALQTTITAGKPVP